MSKLDGMEAIRDYYGYSAPTILSLIRTAGFPAVKQNGGMWVSDTELIDKWRIHKIEMAMNEERKGKKGGK